MGSTWWIPSGPLCGACNQRQWTFLARDPSTRSPPGVSGRSFFFFFMWCSAACWVISLLILPLFSSHNTARPRNKDWVCQIRDITLIPVRRGGSPPAPSPPPPPLRGPCFQPQRWWLRREGGNLERYITSEEGNDLWGLGHCCPGCWGQEQREGSETVQLFLSQQTAVLVRQINMFVRLWSFGGYTIKLSYYSKKHIGPLYHAAECDQILDTWLGMCSVRHRYLLNMKMRSKIKWRAFSSSGA